MEQTLVYLRVGALGLGLLSGHRKGHMRVRTHKDLHLDDEFNNLLI